MTSFRAARVLTALALLLPAAALLGPVAPAAAGTTTISVTDFQFSRTSVQVAMGGTVSWQFHAEHTTTSDQRFWDSGHRSSGAYTVTFPDAGTYRYHCSMHPEMTGAVKVPLRVRGSAATGWTLRWSVRSSTPANRRYDVQYRRAGTSRWTALRTGTASRSARFNPARSATYQLRVCTHNGSVGASGWTPVVSVRIS